MSRTIPEPVWLTTAVYEVAADEALVAADVAEVAALAADVAADDALVAACATCELDAVST